MPAEKYRAICKQHRPKCYRVVERELKGEHDGFVNFPKRTIVVYPVTDNYDLFVYLHECGHVHSGHGQGESTPAWRDEYEADQYAIKAMRAGGFAINRKQVTEFRRQVAEAIEKWEQETGEHVNDEDVLRYAYGRSWRKHT